MDFSSPDWSFGAKLQMTWCNDSFWFCVSQPSHPARNFLSPRRSNTGLTTFKIAGGMGFYWLVGLFPCCNISLIAAPRTFAGWKMLMLGLLRSACIMVEYRLCCLCHCSTITLFFPDSKSVKTLHGVNPSNCQSASSTQSFSILNISTWKLKKEIY